MTLVKPSEVPADSLAAYLQEIGRSPLLTAEEEVELARRIEAGIEAAASLENGSTEEERRRLEGVVSRGRRARTRFLESNARLVVSIAKRYRGAQGVELIDLIQEGNLGLMRAVDKFDWRKGFKFSTYATWWIRQAVTRALQEKSRTIRVPPRLHDALLTVNAEAAAFHAEFGRAPSIAELAERTGLEERRVKEALAVGDISSLESPVGEEGAVLGDFVVPDDEPAIEESIVEADVSDRLRRAIARLGEREQVILNHRFGLQDGEPRTRGDIGDDLGLTAERIGQIERAALCKIRHPAFGLLESDFT